MKNQELKKPFFANFLENELTKEASNEVQGGVTSRIRDVETTKPIFDTVQTMKYPSDNDESGIDI